MGRAPCCSKDADLNRGAWTAEEDMILSEYIAIHGDGGWRSLPQKAGLKRCGKSCRLRWLNYLHPHINRGNISQDEEELIIRMHGLLGNRWSLIAGRLPGRTDNQIKNYWNTRLSKKLHNNGSTANKTEKLNTKFKSPSCPEDQNMSEVIPVKATAVRVAKGLSNQGFMIDSQVIRDSNSWHDLLVDESTTDHDLQFVGYKFADSSLEINGQSSSDSLGLLNSPDCNLFSPVHFSMNFRVEEFKEGMMNVLKQEHDDLESNVQQQWSFTVCDEQGIEEIYNNCWVGEF
ncbi:hypothetical protein SUGI_1002520 [Cryptomeria japonica]|uniref:transcription factor MYB1 n=1 Tax=Cryptomeria japonica TaxID=3369 RepID=UPI002414C340|nr:transcription factor MYB1 [Cryptomeria japonica]GLJ47492.1 hypothetical protein SUGI_1002520 [Cryptomeria japonica]